MGASLDGGTSGRTFTRRQEAERAEHDVDQEDRAPGESGNVGRNDEAGHDGPGEGSARHDRPEHGEHGRHLLSGETGDQDAEALGNQQCAEPALHEPKGDQHGRVDGEATAERGKGEAGDPDEEDTPLPVAVTESPADHEQDTEGEGVARAQPLDQGLTAPDVADDRRGGDVGDRRVHEVEDVGDDDDGQDGLEPPAQAGRIRRLPPASSGRRRPPGPHPVRALMRWPPSSSYGVRSTWRHCTTTGNGVRTREEDQCEQEMGQRRHTGATR